MLDKMMEDFIANPPYVSQSKYEEKLNEYIGKTPAIYSIDMGHAKAGVAA